MGAGKTTFIKALCEVLEVQDNTSSPTFSIVNEYNSSKGPIFHFDFYRIKEEEEAYDFGYEDYFYSGNYCFVEWPNKIPNLIPEDAKTIEIEITSATSRKIIIK
ncbi:tRNA threonylcarbamoyladenosine biosynthesis protein TsaE [compost metagenome]